MIASPNHDCEIEEYMLAFGEDRESLTDMVNFYLKEGWLLYGFPYVADNGLDSNWHYQAMLKYKDIDASSQVISGFVTTPLVADDSGNDDYADTADYKEAI